VFLRHRAGGEVRLRPLRNPLEEQSLRKSLIAAGAAVLAIGGAGVAYAQNAAPSIVVNTSVSPSKAGTKKKPKAEKFTITVTNNVTESKATASSIKISFPKTLKLSTKGLPQCTKSDDAILAAPKTACKKSLAGSGTSHVLLGNTVSGPPFDGGQIEFKVTPIVGKNQMLYYITSPIAQAVLHGKLSGNTQTIRIPDGTRGTEPNLQQPAPGLYAAIVDLKTTISLKKGKHSLVTSSGCSAGGQVIGVTETFVGNPAAPASNTAKASGTAPCKK
jgi:hypothetical protein